MVPNFELRLMETAVAARDQRLALNEAKVKCGETMANLAELLNQAMREVDNHNIEIVNEDGYPVTVRFYYEQDEDVITLRTE